MQGFQIDVNLWGMLVYVDWVGQGVSQAHTAISRWCWVGKAKEILGTLA